MKTLTVTVNSNCEDLANSIFPRGSEWGIVSEDYQGDNIIVEYEWNGDMQTAVEQNLNTHPSVISYTIS